MATAYHNILTEEELAAIAALPEVATARAQIDAQPRGASYFSVRLPAPIKATLQERLGLDVEEAPMRWIKGDTHAHTDRGVAPFQRTTLMYVTDSPGELRVGPTAYPITAGSAYTFPEGIRHETIDTGDEPRLLLGPMSEQGFAVGGSPFIRYYPTEANALAGMNQLGGSYSYVIGTTNFGTTGGFTSWKASSNSIGIFDVTAVYPNGFMFSDGVGYIYRLYPAAETTIDCKPVTASLESQLSTSQRSSLLGAAILYGEVKANEAAGKITHFKSAAEYTAYKKAAVIAASKPDARPVQSTIVTQLRKFCE